MNENESNDVWERNGRKASHTFRGLRHKSRNVGNKVVIVMMTIPLSIRMGHM
jgi:hypothetical protein